MSLQYIIDGYNIINHPQFTATHKNNLLPQLSLAGFIRAKNLSGSRKNKVTLVFDGYPPPDTRTGDEGGINVIFSRRISADEKIKMLVEEAANRKNIAVVTDDKEISFMVKSLGARCLGVGEFIGAKEKSTSSRKKGLTAPELNYSQMHKINEELRRIWLK
jgi:predicted RNA-binding protein with PIN domain